MSEQADPLQALVVDTRQVNRDALAGILKGRVVLDLELETVNIVREARDPISARHAVLLALLGRKAMSLLKSEVVDAISPKELEEITGVKGNTIRPIVRRLADEGLIVRRPKGYTVHNAALHLVASALTHTE